MMPDLAFDHTPKFWAWIFCVLWYVFSRRETILSCFLLPSPSNAGGPCRRIHRYLRLIVHTFSHWLYKSKPIPTKPSFTSDDVTVIIPTIHNAPDELISSLRSILACNPFELILVTTADKFGRLQKVANGLGFNNIRVLHTMIANKRLQVCEAIPTVKTRITVMADDDVTWPSTLLPWLLAPFEDESFDLVVCQFGVMFFPDRVGARQSCGTH